MQLFPNYSACTWCTTTLSTGPVLGGAYVCNITSLSASTVYQYRAYAVIDDVPYYGNILSGCTTATPSGIPLVCTGPILPASISPTSMLIECNEMCDDCGAPIAEYGALYTQISLYGTPTTLCYQNYPAHVCKSSICGTVNDGCNYFTILTGLTPNTMTYYRAFAKNVNGSGYGDICTQITAPPPVIAVTACICVTSTWYNEEQGYICLDPPLASGQWAQLSIDYNQINCGVTYTDVARIRIYCKPDGVAYFSEITTAIDPDYYMCTDVSRFCGYGGGQFMINCGDEICFSNQVEYAIGSCSSFCIHPYDSSPDISISAHPDYCESCVVIT
jgi:hypothetical protein